MIPDSGPILHRQQCSGYVQSATENYTGCDCISVADAAAVAVVRSLVKGLSSHNSTFRAFHAGAACVHPNGLLTGAYCLVSDLIQEYRPPGIHHGTGVAHLRQALHVQILDSDQVEFIDQPPAELMAEVFSTGRDLLVNALKPLHGFTAVLAALLLAFDAPLSASQLALRGSAPARIADLLARAERGECSEADIDTDGRHDGGGLRRCLPILDQQLGIPAGGAADDPQRTLLTWNPLVAAAELDESEFRHADIRLKPDVSANREEYDTGVAAMRTESRKSRFPAILDPPEERDHTTFNATDSVPENVFRGATERRDSFSPSGQKFALVDVFLAFPATLVCLDPVFQAPVIDPAGRSHPTLKRFSLRWSWI